MYRTLSIYVSSYSNSPVKLHHLSKIIAPSVIIKPLDKITTLVENQYILRQKSDNNRTLETGIKKGLETNSCPNNRKTPQAGLEPATLRLTVECSAIELLRIM